MKILALLLSLLCGPAFAQGGMMPGPGTPHTSGLPGPPTFTFQGGVTCTQSTTSTCNSLPIGACPVSCPNRFVVIVIINWTASGGDTVASSLFDGVTSGTNTTVSGACAGAGGAAGNACINVITANIATTTSTTNLVVTFAAGMSGSARAYAYTTDQTTLASVTPVVSNTIATSGLLTLSNSVAVANSGSYEIAAFAGGANGANSFGGTSSPAITNDSTFNVTLIGHSASVAAGTATAVVNWTPSGGGLLGSAIFR